MKGRGLWILLFVCLPALSGCGWYNDYKVTKKVKDILTHDAQAGPLIDNNKVTWNVTNGVVKVRGTVCQQTEKDHFTEIIKDVEGVKSVDNGIEVDTCQGSNPLFLNPFG